MKEDQMRQNLKRIIADRTKRTRESLGLTQAEMAKKLLIDVRSYCDIEAGRSLPSVSTLMVYLTQLDPDATSFLDELADEIYTEEGQL